MIIWVKLEKTDNFEEKKWKENTSCVRYINYFSRDKNIFSFYHARLDFFVNSIPNFSFIFVEKCCVNMTIASVDSIFDSLPNFTRRRLKMIRKIKWAHQKDAIIKQLEIIKVRI